MNLLVFRSGQRQGDVLTATGEQSQHIRDVLKGQPGEILRVGELGGLMGCATLISSEGLCQLRIESLDTPPPPKLPLTLLLAMPRPKVFRRMLQAVSSLGVERLILLNSWRVEKSYWQTPWLQPGTLEANLILGLEQACDTVLPDVLIRKRFKPFIEDELPALLTDAQGWVAHPYSDTIPHPRAVAGTPHHTVLAIGPEGGFIPYEVEKLQAVGMQGLSLGPRILKVDTAISALIGKLFL
ncbi:MAG: 16S rRNA (uracil(1498)-N(3))-methyltransferase [Hahellaceae bacterium]|nr:16S rRNA (uracil(1498)-N(3))-methyltransferase [Hahellaceae bacterium]